MFLARTKLDLGAAALRMHVALHPRVLLIFVERRGLAYDTRLVASDSPLLAGGLVIYLILRGRIVWHATNEVFGAPCSLVLRDEDFEGAGGPGSPTFRTDSPVFRALEVRVAAECSAPSAPRPLDPVLARAAEAYCSATLEGASLPEPRTVALANDLLGEIVRAELATGLDDIDLSADEPRHLEVLWDAIASIFEELDLGATQDMLAGEALLSTRQVHRDVGEILGRFRLPAKGWRDAVRAWRLRLAVVLLSAEEVPIASVAKAVGYARSEAMANAFQAAGLSSPLAVRRALRAAAAAAPKFAIDE
jgi:AraC-like DNA-binding protein